MIWRKLYFIVAANIFSLLILNNVYALNGDESQPIQVDADHATADQKNLVTVFDGNVVISRGSLVVHAAQATASQDAKGDRVLVLTGAPVTFVQTADDGQKIEGQGNKFTYTTKNNLAVLSGRARVKKGKNIIMGDTITYNTKTEVYNATSGFTSGVDKKPSGRVTVILDQVGDEKAKK